MKDKPLVSVITTFLNGERFIREAIESVFAQTYTNWELILVDDGSTDKSTGIALEYVNDNPGKVFYLEHPGHVNKGISASRNLGIGSSGGKYIATIDADDKWVERKLEEQVDILEIYPEASMVYGATKYWYSWTGNPQDAGRDFVIDLGVKPNTLIPPPTILLLALESKTITASMSNVMFRKEAAVEHGCFEESFPGMHEDLAFLAKLYLDTPVFIADSCWDVYRRHDESCYNVAMEKNRERECELYYLAWLNNYLLRNANGNREQQLLKALHEREWKFKNPGLYKLQSSYRRRIGDIKSRLKPMAKDMVPKSVIRYTLSKLRGDRYRPPVGFVDFGELRNFKPVSSCWGEDRGLPIDRYYIEKFLDANAGDIKGKVLEIGDDRYTKKFGSAVTHSDILNLSKGANPQTTIVADLSSAPEIPSDTFDCIVFTQTLMLIYDLHSTIETLYRILKPGGVILATLGGICPSTDEHAWDRNWCWRFSSVSAEKLFKESFPAGSVEVQGYGNLIVCISFLSGLATEELQKEELDHFDHNYEILITVKATKPV